MTPFERIIIINLIICEASLPSQKIDWDVGLPFTLPCTLHTASEGGREGGVDDDRRQAAGPPTSLPPSFPPLFLGRPKRQNLNKAL